MIKTDKGKLDVESVYDSFHRAVNATKGWRKEAQECFAYLAGDQYEEGDLEALEEDRRPAIEFNQYAIYIETVCGLEQLQREEVNYSARVPGQPTGVASDILNSAARYVASDSDAGMHQSHAFRDMVTCGMGWTETRMDYTTNANGDVIAADHLDPINEMYWDSKATKTNVGDSQWVLRLKAMTRAEVEDRWPQKAGKIAWDKRFSVPPDWGVDVDKKPQEEYQTTPGGKLEYQPDDDAEIYVGHVQWYENEPYYRIVAADGTQVEASKAEWRAFAKENPELAEQADAVLLKKRTYKQAFVVGGTVLEEGPGPCEEDFTFQCMTGKYDRNNNVWYGLGRSLISPQRWVNKMYSALIETIALGPKGTGIMVEVGSHPNIRELMDRWADPAYIPAFNPGALQGGKVVPKPSPPFPQGIDRLMQIAMGMFQHVSGVNPELLGLVSREQAGVLEYQRKQASMTTLSWAFNSMRQYRKSHGRVLAYFIKKYISDGRLIRVSGQEKAQYLPLTKDADLMEYDIEVDTAPSAPNEKDRVFAIIRELLPIVMPLGIMPPADVLDYLPLPTTLIEKWKERLNQPDPMAETSKQLAIQKQQADIQKVESAAMLDQVKAQSEMVKGQMEASKLELEKIKLGHETQMMQQKAWFEQISATQKQQAAEMQMRLQEQKMVADQQSSMMELIKADLEQRRMQETFMISQAERQQKAQLDMMGKMQDIKMTQESSAQDMMLKQVDALKGIISDFAGSIRQEVSKSKTDPESTRVDDPQVSIEMLQALKLIAEEIVGLKEKAMKDEEDSTDIERDDTGRIARIGRKRIIRDDAGMIVRIES